MNATEFKRFTDAKDEIQALREIVADWLEFCLNPNRGNNQQADPLDRLIILITKSKKATQTR